MVEYCFRNVHLNVVLIEIFLKKTSYRHYAEIYSVEDSTILNLDFDSERKKFLHEFVWSSVFLRFNTDIILTIQSTCFYKLSPKLLAGILKSPWNGQHKFEYELRNFILYPLYFKYTKANNFSCAYIAAILFIYSTGQKCSMIMYKLIVTLILLT
jgi:hypothetical protein